jgi:preprotein translocase subunit YajC
MLISEAYAQNAPAGPSFMDPQMLILVFMFVAMFFLIIRPQMKRAKEQKQMVASLAKGDEVVTAGGTLGRIAKVGDHYINLEIAPNVEITVQKSSIQMLLPKGTLKSVS